ncbi:MAG: ABC transporter ATP-binding protein [Patescibacteria group bacterium]|nr:ABC transporter ATP-binding protein [Patescibacteria group bacterium]
MHLIEVKDLEKTYYIDSVQTPALRGVSFKIKEGEFVAIVGPSGSGKSTLLHVLGFLDRHTAGEYHFDGKTINDYSEEEIARVRNKEMGFIFQTFNLLPRTTVLENVKLPLLYSGVKESLWEKKARQVIDSVGLSHRLHHESSQLSGGEIQRVAIARALVNNPRIIFADEPTGNLDSKSGKVIMELIQKLNNDGHTVILITHETYTAKHAERLIRLSDGAIKEDAPVDHRLVAADHFTK